MLPSVSLTPLPPKDALAYFRAKGLSPSFAWQDVWQEEHARAFTVAKAMNCDILEDIRNAMDKALAEGQTLETFKKNLKPVLQAKGWWGRKTLTDPLTGKGVRAQLGSDRRLKTIFQTNMRVSYAVGNWQRAWATRDTFPYLQYQHNSDRFPRPQHVAWSGTCLPIDDVWWDTHYPPCAWGCNCSVNSLSKRMMADRGVTVTTRPKQFPKRTYVNPRTGEVSQIEEGIDAGWNYNVGKTPLRGLMPSPEAPAPDVHVPPQGQLETAKDAFLKEMGADSGGKVIKDKGGWPLAIGDGMFRNDAGELAMPRPDLLHHLPDVAKALKSYDKVENIWQAQAAGAGPVEQSIDGAVKAAKTGDQGVTVRFAKVGDGLADLAGKHQVEIADFDHAIDGSAVRHILANHGSVAEGLRGQVPVTAADIRRLSTIVGHPDHVVFGLRTKIGTPAIGFVTKMHGAVYVYVAELRRGRWVLAAKTLWKYPDTADALDIAKRLGLHGQTDAGAKAIVVDAAGKGNPPPRPLLARIVRRYTKVIDNRRITVDFSKGAWTFDVVPLKGDQSGP